LGGRDQHGRIGSQYITRSVRTMSSFAVSEASASYRLALGVRTTNNCSALRTQEDSCLPPSVARRRRRLPAGRQTSAMQRYGTLAQIAINFRSSRRQP
jgi:hypothetical protein